jgi:hypothetical protein
VKEVATKYLDACPTDVIRRFMSAYRLGLTGKAADCAVRKQRGYRSVSAGAYDALEAVVAKRVGVAAK